jgi:hypothetical protein
MTPASNEQTTAAQIASELGQPTRGKGVDRLAAAIVEAVTTDICEWEACERLAELPGCTWVFAHCSVGYTPQYANANKAPSFYVEAKRDGVAVDFRSKVGFLEAVEQVEKKWADEVRIAARKATIAERIEREMKEADAAEAALKETAPIPFDDGTGLGLPVIVQESVPLDMSNGLAAAIEKRSIELTGRGTDQAEHDPFDGVSPADGEVGR